MKIYFNNTAFLNASLESQLLLLHLEKVGEEGCMIHNAHLVLLASTTNLDQVVSLIQYNTIQ